MGSQARTLALARWLGIRWLSVSNKFYFLTSANVLAVNSFFRRFMGASLRGSGGFGASV